MTNAVGVHKKMIDYGKKRSDVNTIWFWGGTVLIKLVISQKISKTLNKFNSNQNCARFRFTIGLARTFSKDVVVIFLEYIQTANWTSHEPS